jgi:RNA polymerase sigma-70 factor (ECF subfamily)
MRDADDGALAAAARGDRAAVGRAFERVFAEHREQVLAVCLRLTGNAADAEDALQECFVDVLRGLPGFRGESRLTTWIYRIAIRAAGRVRARSLRRRGVPLERASEPAVEPRVPIEEREAVDAVLEALAELALEHRTVIALCSIEGLDAKEVAEILGVPPGTVWSRLARARELLRERLARRAR